MGLFDGLASWLGWGGDKAKHGQDAPEQQRCAPGSKRPRSANSPGPVIQDAGYAGSGGVQGLHWFASSLRTDADGDAAHEFWCEPATEHDPAAPLQRERPCGGTSFWRRVVCTRLGSVQVNGDSLDPSLHRSKPSSDGAG